MYNPIEDYSIIGDTRTTALISRNGSIDWLCWPRHDSPALFLRLIDDDIGGFSDVEIPGSRVICRRYLVNTNILETTFECSTGRAVLRDFMPVNSPDTSAEQRPDGNNESCLLRAMVCLSGKIEGEFRTKPSFDFARAQHQVSVHKGRITYKAEGECLEVHSAASHQLDGAMSRSPFSLTEGKHTFLALSYRAGQDIDGRYQHDFESVLASLKRTRQYWETWSARCTYLGRYREAVLRSALCLKLLTYSPTGAIIAAPTLGLPEAVPGNRNYDYRYSWLRDASFTVTSFVNLGYVREATEYLRFLRNADRTRGKDLQLLYAIAGPVPPERELTHLKGWRGVRPISTGNAARDQQQFDIYGEYLIALHFWLEALDYDVSTFGDFHLPELVTNLATAALAHRDGPDHGIWELRSGKQHSLHTKALIFLALDRAAKIGRKIEGVDFAQIDAWEQNSREIRDEYLTRAWSERYQCFMQSYDSATFDAAVMRVALFGAIDPNSSKMRLTVATLTKELGVDDLMYRYRMDDGMSGQEATFTACAFWRVGCLALSGKAVQARGVFERLLQRANDVGLFAEEIDAATGSHRGNFPQAFTHMAVINHALRLESL